MLYLVQERRPTVGVGLGLLGALVIGDPLRFVERPMIRILRLRLVWLRGLGLLYGKLARVLLHKDGVDSGVPLQDLRRLQDWGQLVPIPILDVEFGLVLGSDLII